MIDPTAQTKPLTKGQQIVADYERDMIAEPAELAAAIDAALGEVVERMTPLHGRGRWRCFHCHEPFVTYATAREHFGATVDAIPACQIKFYERHLVTYIRKLENDLDDYRTDSGDVIAAVYQLEAEIVTAKRDAEQLGYDRGLRDGLKEAKGGEL